MGNENTHVANACSNEILIFFQSGKLHAAEIATEVTTEAGVSVSKDVEGSMKAGAKINILLKPDSRVQYLRCPSREYIKIPLQGNIYITIVCRRGDKDELMCMNFMIPSDRSVIITNTGMLKYAKYGSLWKDEDDRYY